MKQEEVSTITNTFFSALPDKSTVNVAGVIKAIEDKETTTATAKRFKGQIGVQLGDTVYLGKYVFLPVQMRDALLEKVAKIGKWSTFEFAFSAKKTLTVNPAKSSWEITFTTLPRVELPRVLALLEE